MGKVPVVPTYENRIQANTTVAPLNPMTAAPASAFGADQERGQVFKALEGIGDKAMEVATRWKRQDEQDEATKLSNDFRQKQWDVLFNPETDEKGVPKGLLKRPYDSANGIGDEYMQKIGAVKASMVENASDDNVRRLLAPRIEEHDNSMRDNVFAHEIQQKEKSRDLRQEQALNQYVQRAAVITNPDDLQKELAAQADDYRGYLQSKGMKDDLIAPMIRDQNDKVVAAMVKGQLDSNPLQAKATLEALPAGVVSKDTRAKLKDALKEKEVEYIGAGLASKIAADKGFFNADRSVNLSKVDQVLAAQGLEQKYADKLKADLMPRIAWIEKQRKDKEDNNSYSFLTAAIKAHDSGASIDEARKLAGKYGLDTPDVWKKKEAIDKLYAEPAGAAKSTDPMVQFHYSEGIKSGQLGPTEIYQGYQRGELSRGTTSTLLNMASEFKKKPQGPDDIYVAKTIKEMAHKELGDKQKEAEYLNAWEAQTVGKSAAERLKIGKDLLQTDKNTGGWFGIGADKNFESANKQKVQNLENTAAIYDAYGKDVVLGIGQGSIATTGKRSWGMDTVKAFGDQLGGVEKLQKGTPENDAIQYLMRSKKAVTPEAVRTVVKYYGGKVPR